MPTVTVICNAVLPVKGTGGHSRFSEAIRAAMRDVALFGRSAARHLRGDIYEVRVRGPIHAWRVLFSVEGSRHHVLLALSAFEKKTQKTPDRELESRKRWPTATKQRPQRWRQSSVLWTMRSHRTTSPRPRGRPQLQRRFRERRRHVRLIIVKTWWLRAGAVGVRLPCAR